MHEAARRAGRGRLTRWGIQLIKDYPEIKEVRGCMDLNHFAATRCLLEEPDKRSLDGLAAGIREGTDTGRPSASAISWATASTSVWNAAASHAHSASGTS